MIPPFKIDGFQTLATWQAIREGDLLVWFPAPGGPPKWEQGKKFLTCDFRGKPRVLPDGNPFFGFRRLNPVDGERFVFSKNHLQVFVINTKNPARLIYFPFVLLWAWSEWCRRRCYYAAQILRRCRKKWRGESGPKTGKQAVLQDMWDKCSSLNRRSLEAAKVQTKRQEAYNAIDAFDRMAIFESVFRPAQELEGIISSFLVIQRREYGDPMRAGLF